MTHFTEDSGTADQKIKSDQEPIQLDLYGVKVRFAPAQRGEEPGPESWAEVARRVHQDLKAIAVGLIRLIRITIEGTSNLVAGISALPSAFAVKVQKGHHRSDELEKEQQHKNEISPSSRDLADAQRRISALLSRKMIEGNMAGIATDEKDDFLVVYILKPDAEASVPSIVEQTGKALQLSGGLAEVEGNRKMLMSQSTEMNKEFFRLFSLLHDGQQQQLARTLSCARLSTGRERIYITSNKLSVLDDIRNLLDDPCVKGDFEAAIQSAFGIPLKWSIIFEDGAD